MFVVRGLSFVSSGSVDCGLIAPARAVKWCGELSGLPGIIGCITLTLLICIPDLARISRSLGGTKHDSTTIDGLDPRQS